MRAMRASASRNRSGLFMLEGPPQNMVEDLIYDRRWSGSSVSDVLSESGINLKKRPIDILKFFKRPTRIYGANYESNLINSYCELDKLPRIGYWSKRKTIKFVLVCYKLLISVFVFEKLINKDGSWLYRI